MRADGRVGELAGDLAASVPQVDVAVGCEDDSRLEDRVVQLDRVLLDDHVVVHEEDTILMGQDRKLGQVEAQVVGTRRVLRVFVPYCRAEQRRLGHLHTGPPGQSAAGGTSADHIGSASSGKIDDP